MTNTPDKSELLPCPFCGNDASVSDGSNGLHFRVICNKSACRAAGPLERCAVDAKDAWNVRAPSRPADQVPDMVERLGETLHDLSDSLRQIGFFSGERKHIARYEAVVSAFENLAALQAVPASGEEPTQAMVEAGCQQWTSWGHAEPIESVVKRIYAAMRAASGEE